MKPKLTVIFLLTLIGISSAQTAVAEQTKANQPATGAMECNSVRGNPNTRQIWFAAIQSTASGFDLLIVEELGNHLISLNKKLVVQAAGTIGDQKITAWNLVSYDGKPLVVKKDGTFSLGMAVSTRSFCQFQGTARFLGQAGAELFRSP